MNVVNALVCGARCKSSPWYVDPRSGSGMTFFESRGDMYEAGSYQARGIERDVVLLRSWFYCLIMVPFSNAPRLLWLGLCLTAQKQHWCDGGKADMIASLCSKRVWIK